MLDDKDEFAHGGWVWVHSLGELDALCMYPEDDAERAGYTLATEKEVQDGGFRLKSGENPKDPTAWLFDWRLRVA